MSTFFSDFAATMVGGDDALPGPPFRTVQRLCPQPWRGSLAYLHLFFPGLDQSGLMELEAILGRDLPPGLKDFYRASNGASLFENCLFIYGLVREFSRDPDVRNPLGPEFAIACFHRGHPQWAATGYFPIGGLALYRRKATIACDSEHRVAVIDDQSGEALREYSDVAFALRMLCAEMAPMWRPDGMLAVREQALDELIVSGSRA